MIERRGLYGCIYWFDARTEYRFFISRANERYWNDDPLTKDWCETLLYLIMDPSLLLLLLSLLLLWIETQIYRITFSAKAYYHDYYYCAKGERSNSIKWSFEWKKRRRPSSNHIIYCPNFAANWLMNFARSISDRDDAHFYHSIQIQRFRTSQRHSVKQGIWR